MNINSVHLQNNHVLVYPSGTYDRVKIAGGHELFVGITHENRGKHVSITGKVLKVPEELLFHKELLDNTSNQEERRSLTTMSMPWDTEMVLEAGDDVVFDYIHSISAYQEGRVLDIDGYGECYLIPYYSIYGYSRGVLKVMEYTPINGFVFFKRDKAKDRESRNGIEVLYKTGDYDENWGEVVSADLPVKNYLHQGEDDYGLELRKGDRVYIQGSHGFRIAYDIHAPDHLHGVEAIRRSHILFMENGGVGV